MKKAVLGCLFAAALPLAAQIQFGLEGLAAKASNTVDISLDPAMLKLAGSFLAGDKSQNPGFQKVLSGLKNITVKSFTFNDVDQYKSSDVDPIRERLRAAGWSKMIGVNEKKGGTDIFAKSDNGQIAGLAVIAAEPKELTVVYIEGAIDLEKLAQLAGHLGIPALGGIIGQQGEHSKSKDE